MARRGQGLQGTPAEHAARFEQKIETANRHVREGEKATTCDAMMTAALQSSGAGGAAAAEASWVVDPFMRKQIDKKLDAHVKRAIRLDEKIREKCTRGR